MSSVVNESLTGKDSFLAQSTLDFNTFRVASDDDSIQI